METVRSVARETAIAWGPREGYLRLIVSRGVGALGLDPRSCPTPTIVCIAAGTVRLAPEKAARGIDLITSSLRRPSGDVLDPRVKSLNYLNNILAKREANLRGADDALMLNARGLVAEASAANIFTLTGNRLDTPAVSDGALEVLGVSISMLPSRSFIQARGLGSCPSRPLMARRSNRRPDLVYKKFRRSSRNA